MTVVAMTLHFLLNATAPTQTDDRIQPPENTLYVGGSSLGSYTTIGDAIRAAEKDDTVFVHSGTYHENVVVDKQIRLIGEGRDTTIVDAGGRGDAVRITAGNTLLSGFTCRNGGTGPNCLDDASIEIVSDNNIVRNNTCLSTNYGIWVLNSAGNTIQDNICDAEYDGIWLMNSRNTILRNNSMTRCGLVIDGTSLQDFLHDVDTSNTANGKPVYYYRDRTGEQVPDDAGQVILVNCKHCTVSDLEISDVTDGIEILYSNENTIKNNRITDTTDFGIRLVKSDGNTIENNICSGSPIGIGFMSGGRWVYGIDANCHHNTVQKNTLSDNQCGVWINSSDYNMISKNNFIGNRISAFFTDSHKNKWRGNYWERPRIMPKIILGTKTTKIFSMRVPWVNIDLFPRKIPLL